MRTARPNKGVQQTEGEVDERLKNIDTKMVELITNEVGSLYDGSTFKQINDYIYPI